MGPVDGGKGMVVEDAAVMGCPLGELEIAVGSGDKGSKGSRRVCDGGCG